MAPPFAASAALPGYLRLHTGASDVIIDPMPENLDSMMTALRVLVAITDRQPPDPADVEALRRYAGSVGAVSADDLACDVIQQALRRRAAGRRTVGDSTS
jgi:hypothetical protein